MRRALLWIALALLPLGGFGTLAVAWVRLRTLPDEADLARLQTAVAELQRTRAELMAQPPASADELTDRLPKMLTVGAMLQRIEHAARQAGVRAVSFGSEEVAREADPGGARGGRSGTGDAHGDGGSEPLAAAEPERMRCLITIESDYGALVQFLGLMETMPQVTRVCSLRVVSLPQGISARVGLEGYAYAGDGNSVPLAAPAPEGR